MTVRFRHLRPSVPATLALTVLSLLGSPAPSHAGDAAWSPSFDDRLKRAFARERQTPEAPYDQAFVYFVTSFHDRAEPGGSRALQPGAPSVHGAASDGFESFARLAPMVATWLAGGRAARVTDLHGQPLDLPQLLHDGIVSGTTPGGPAYWGDVGEDIQRIVEATDIARTIWTVRDLGVLTPAELHGAAAWLRPAVGSPVSDNNFHLFPVLIGTVLAALGEPTDQAVVDAHFKRFMEFYRGDGWFSDGPETKFDFYNAWGIHYDLFWLRRISPGFGGDAVRDAMRQFVANYAHLIGPRGIPIFGRSICYRMAAPSPLIAAALDSDGAQPSVAPGLARRSLDAVWDYFIANGGVADGVPTQGYCGADLRILDNYSGPGSCLWGLRSLILAFLAPPDAPLWTAAAEKLPVERGNDRITIPTLHWTVEGTARTGEIRIIRSDAPLTKPAAIIDYGPVRRMVSRFLWPVLNKPLRPQNWAAKYDGPTYSSATPFCGCVSPPEASLAAVSAKQ